MNQATHSNDDIALGAKVISYSIQALGFIASMAMASACSSAIIGLLVAFISGIVLYLLSHIASLFVIMAMDVKHVALVGSTTTSVMFKLGSLFSKRAA